MIRTKNLIPDEIVTYRLHQTFGGHKVIESPAHIFGTGTHHVGPKGVLALFVWIKMTISIDKALVEQVVKA